MSLILTLETDTPMPQHFRYITGGYRVAITYTLVDDIIDIIIATIKPHDSDITSTISPYMHAELRRHYHDELVQYGAQFIEKARENLADTLLGRKIY